MKCFDTNSARGPASPRGSSKTESMKSKTGLTKSKAPRRAAPTPRILPFAPRADFLAVDQVCRAAGRSGWPTRLALEVPMLLTVKARVRLVASCLTAIG